MTYKVCSKWEPEKAVMRDVYTSTLIGMAEKDWRVMALDADLLNAVGIRPFQKAFPDRMINCGVAEANMMGVAAGLSIMGFVPYAHSFAAFATRRAADQIYMSNGFAKTNVRIVGSDPGATSAFNGATHMGGEDLGIIRGIPGTTVLEPTDTAMLQDLLLQSLDWDGVYYFRISRKGSIQVYEPGSTFDIRKANVLREGKDVTLIASGICVSECLEAAELLTKENIEATVIDVFCVKPIDRETIIKSAARTGAVVTAENHQINNGLGSAVAEVLVEGEPVPMERVGIQDRFGEVGPLNYLVKQYGLDRDTIVQRAKKAIARKKKR